jgi:methionine-rich copper-binding protein CopC
MWKNKSDCFQILRIELKMLTFSTGGPLRRLLSQLCVTSLIFVAGASSLYAHAVLVSSMPKAGAVLGGGDVPISLIFNSKVDQARSTLTLEGPAHTNAPVPIEKSESNPAQLAGHIKGLQPGAYKLHWQVLAVDGHITRGQLSFTVK